MEKGVVIEPRMDTNKHELMVPVSWFLIFILKILVFIRVYSGLK